MATVYATWDDVVTTYEGTLPVEHKPRVEKLLAQASARLTALVPSLPARLTAGRVDPDLAEGMVVEAVLRVYRNPAGVSQQSTGPFSRSLTKDAAHPGIHFDPEEVAALLSGAADSSGIGTFGVGIPASGTPFAAPVSAAAVLDADGRYIYSPEQVRAAWSR